MGRPDKDDSQAITLAPWEEVTGRVVDINVVEDEVEVRLSIRGAARLLRYNADSREAEILRNRLVDEIGSTVSVLRTDSQEIPLSVDVDRDV